MKFFLRTIHFIISSYFLFCVLFLYYSIITNRESKLLFITIISVLLEGIIVFLNQKDCPLGILHKRYGDNKTFFELFFPKEFARQVIPALGTIAMIGLIIYFIERLMQF